MELATVGADLLAPATGVTEGITPELGAAIAPEVRMEAHVDSRPRMSTDVVVCEPKIEETAPIRSVPMSEVTSTIHGGLELLDDNLVDPAVVARNMESMRRAEQLSYGPPWAHYLSGYQDRLLGGPLGLPGLRYTTPDGVEHKDCGEVLD
jgi:hypothetical protein